ncbi:HD domain-containing protein [Helicobacter labacensis]|uniref:hypothetical protein n=1 Tax=Helicobacter labacensis TaxID=2316079 RepID=UPI001F2C80F0|nr:hypothetical protein [Helicobacter labacensis]
MENPNLWLKKQLQHLHLGQLRALLGFYQAQDPLLSARLKRALKRILKNHEVYSLRYLALRGTDLIELGFQGAQIGALLQACLEGVMCGAVRNDKGALLEWLQTRLGDRALLG